jgi:MerR family copper efflux transcriptional regulator
MLPNMTHERLLMGELARKAGTTRKALRIYEAAGLLPPARRTASGYRVYTNEALPLLAFILKARRIGFSVAEIKSIVGIRRSGQAPCRHVHDLVRRKAADVERTLNELAEVRKALLGLLRSWPSRQQGPTTVCGHIENFNGSNSQTEVRNNGQAHEDVPVPGVHRLSRGGGRRRRSANR